jgi:hypothetical protein
MSNIRILRACVKSPAFAITDHSSITFWPPPLSYGTSNAEIQEYDIFSEHISYYKLGNFCVCPAIRFHISQRIFSKFGGNLLRVMTHSVGYILCVCTQRVRVQWARNNRVRMLHWWSMKPIIHSGSFIVLCTEQSCLLQTVVESIVFLQHMHVAM